MSVSDLVSAITRRLAEAAPQIRAQWAAPEGTRTRHFAIDDLLPAETCEAIHRAFPPAAEGFFALDSFREKKRTSSDLGRYAPILSDITYAFQDPAIVAQVSDLTGLQRLEPDPRLYAGGLSMMMQGDFLNPHIDNSHDRERRKYRRLNLLYYVSPDWALADGGNFELWDDARRVPKTLVSTANRLVVMETNKTSWHSVSPVRADRARCCVSNYYFSDVSPDTTEYFHVTSYSGRPGETVKQVVGMVDNALRNVVSKTLKIGRGRNRINRPAD